MPTTEGIGGQLCRYSTARILADQYGLTYVHNSFGPDFHCPNLRWQVFLGFSRNAPHYAIVSKRKTVRIYILPRFDLRYLKSLQLGILKWIFSNTRDEKDILYLVNGYSFYPMDEYKNWMNILRILKQDYQETRKKKPVRTHFNTRNITVAVGIRRGEITEMHDAGTLQGLWRWVEVSWYESVLEKIRTACGSRVQVEIFSDAADLSALSVLLRFPNTHIHLMKDAKHQPFEAFHAMATADITVCGLSSFPYFAASLSDGIKIVPPAKVRVNYFPKPPKTGWIFPDEQGQFDTAGIRVYTAKKKLPKSL